MNRILAVVVCLLAAPLIAQPAPSRGDVLVQTFLEENIFESPRYYYLYHVEGNVSTYVGFPPTGHPYTEDSLFTFLGMLAPRPQQLFFVQPDTIAVSTEGRTVARRLPIKAWSEMAPLGTSFIVASEDGRTLDDKYVRHLIVFDAEGTVLARHEFTSPNRWWPALHLEVLSDRCTLLYALAGYSNKSAIFRYDFCKREQLPEFVTNVPYIGSIRQLPDGDILVATGFEVRRFSAQGTLVRTYNVRATRIALTPDASGFWALGDPHWNGRPPAPLLYRIDFASPDVPAATVAIDFARSNADYALSGIHALAVVGEWRAAAAATKQKTRAARH